MKIRKSAQDYLETMLMLREEHGYIRSIDIAERMGVTKPSVSYATRRLRESGYITMDADGLITLTETGREVAGQMFARHQLLAAFLIQLGVDEEIAREDACNMEHDISEETFRALCGHVQKIMAENGGRAAGEP